MTAELVSGLVRSVAESLELGQVLGELLRASRALLRTGRNVVLLTDPGGRLVPRAWDGFDPRALEGEPASVSDPTFALALAAQGPVRLAAADLDAVQSWASRVAGVQSGLAMTIRAGGRALGVLLVADRMVQAAFTEADAALLRELAGQAGLAIDHAQRFEEATTRSRRLATLVELTQRIAGHRPWEELLRVIADEAQRLLGASAAACQLADADELTMAVRAGDEALIAGAPRVRIGEGLGGLVAARASAIRIGDVRAEAARETCGASELAARGVRAYLGAPLVVRDAVLGVLSVYSTDAHRFSEDDAALLSGFAGQAAVAVENARLVDQLLHAERLAAVGRIVAGVAHELNNPLAVVIGTADLLRREGVDERVDERLRRISGQAERAVKIVRSLLALARKQPASWTTVDVNALIEETLELEAYELRQARVTVVRELAPDLPRIVADPNQLQQVLTNLFLNALEAMREARGRGTLTVATRRETGPERVVVAVTDDGPGIHPRDAERVFEPFFTTKCAQKGTGLGLSICRQIVENHRGRIGVEIRPHAGATFTMELPAGGEPVRQPAEAPCEERPAREGRRVLLVEDERVVGDLLAEFLAVDGHQVDRAQNGREALDLVRRRAYALIVSDVHMPDLDGPALFRELAETAPDLARRMIFVTGDVMSPETRRFLEESRLTYLEKPFGITEFHAAIRAILDQSARPVTPAKTA